MPRRILTLTEKTDLLCRLQVIAAEVKRENRLRAAVTELGGHHDVSYLKGLRR